MHPAGQQLLLVDDDPARRAEVERVLCAEGFEVAVVGEGLAAIRAAGQRRFALTVAALGLPGSLDGPETAQQLRARQPGLRTLFLADAGERLHGPVRDCGDVVPWPCRPAELVGCVFEMLQRDPPPALAANANNGHAVYRRG
jgi:DNA-binding response OmpR family regulator